MKIIGYCYHSVNVIKRVCGPKVITLSGFHCNLKLTYVGLDRGARETL